MSDMSDEWRSPQRLVAQLAHRWGPWDLDAAAAPWNAQAPKFFTRKTNALREAQRWEGRVWMNPPYSRGNLARWMSKARWEVQVRHAELVCTLVPAYTCEGWWHDSVEAHAGALLEQSRFDPDELGAAYVRRYQHLVITTLFLRGRLRFVERSGRTGSARFSSAVVVFEQPPTSARRAP